ncbi:hypothetical protein GPJ56_009523 [Histomonas meleagridis]|uniref:uncharacterized protein n=1 Tax=Histomonas meleagridis TaxID=135588 RepID=UPI00355A2DEE|nr:hypothetical protein GPJ56_009523 [Histomonas meleagridis]KAH0802913.1 hypothetical protein GO595_004420 [Histomonas meleagridis]
MPEVVLEFTDPHKSKSKSKPKTKSDKESKKKMKAPSKNQVIKYMNLTCQIIQFPIFILSLICLFNVFKEPNLVNELAFICVLISEAFKMYINGFVNNLSSKLTNEPLIKRVWLGKHFHYMLIAIIFRVANVQSLLYYLDYVLISFVLSMKVIKKELRPRVGDDLKSSVDAITDPFIRSTIIKRTIAALEILLCPYLFFYALFTLKGMVFIAFIAYFFLFILFALVMMPPHNWVYGQIDHYLRKFSSKNESASKFVKKALDNISKVRSLAGQLYPLGTFRTMMQ